MDVRHSHHACPGISQWLLSNALASIISKISNLELKADPRAVQFRWLFDDGDFLSHLPHHLAWILWTREDSTVAVSMVVTRKILVMRSRWTSCEILLPYLYSSKDKTLAHSYMCASRYILVYHHGLEHWNPENNYRAICLSLTALKKKQLGSLGFAGLDWEFTAKDNASKALSTLSTNLQVKSK